MNYIRYHPKILLIALFFSTILLGCTNYSTPIVPSQNTNSTETLISTIITTPHSLQTPIPSPLITSEFTPIPDFPPDIYPSPKPFLNPVNGITTNGCPDLTDLKAETDLPTETAIQWINALRSGDLDTYKKASDQTYWPAPQSVLSTRESVNPSDVQIHPAIQTPYDGLIRTGCGQKTLDLSWWVEVGTGALGEHYFFINRSGHWLVWASYP